MKSLRPLRLKEAHAVGWLAAFPEELWTIMFASLRVDKNGAPELGLLLTLMGTCKMFFRLLKERVIVLLAEFLSFDAANTHSRRIETYVLGKERLFVLVGAVLDSVKYEINLREYLRVCAHDDTHQTVGHLTNALSLMHLAYMEGRYIYLEFYDFYQQPGRYKFAYQSLCMLTIQRKNPSIEHIMYFDPVRRKAQSLLRMTKNVAFKEPGLYIQNVAKRLVANDKSEAKRFAFIDEANSFYEREITALCVKAVVEAGESVITTKAIAGKHRFEDIILTINNTQCSIFSKEASAFREQCFTSHLHRNLEDATYAYILTTNNASNWAIVTTSGRYGIPFIALQK